MADLPDIAALNPAILTARKVRKRTGCGQMPFTDQGFGVNAMAALAAAQLAKQAVVDAVVTRPQIYFDVNTGFGGARMVTRDLYRKWMHKEKTT